MKLKTAITRALAAVPLVESDQGAAQLAIQQAAAIDADPEELKKLGPHLLETLSELGLTPKARNAIVKGGGHVTFDGARGKLAEIRSLRP